LQARRHPHPTHGVEDSAYEGLEEGQVILPKAGGQGEQGYTGFAQVRSLGWVAGVFGNGIG